MKILFLDDHPYLKEGIEMRINEIFTKSAFYFSQDVKTARNLIIENKIDLVICDLDFPEIGDYDGFSLMSSLKKEQIKVKVVAFTSHSAYKILNKARKTGFHSYILKSAPFDEFKNCIQGVINISQKEEYLSDSMKKILKKRYNTQVSVFSNSLNGISTLSNQQKKFLRHVAKTTKRKELSILMCRSANTIDSYYKEIFKKLDISSRSEAQFFAQEFYEKLV